MGKNLERGISEEGLVREIQETLKDARMYWEKLHVHTVDGGVPLDNDDDVTAACCCYLAHIAKLDIVRHCVGLGRKYFQDGKICWDNYDIDLLFSDAPSFMKAKEILRTIEGRGVYVGVEFEKKILGFK